MDITARPAAAIALGLAVLAVGVHAAYQLTRRELHLVEQVLVLAAATLGWVGNLWLLGADPELDYLLWMGWASSALVHLVVLTTCLRVAAAIAAGWTGVVVLGLLRFPDGWLSVWEHSFLLITGPGDVAITLLVLVVAERAAASEALAAQLASSTRLVTARLQSLADIERFWSEAVVDEALPLVEDVAEHRVDPTNPAVQQQATAVGRRLRDELVLGHERRRILPALATLRAHGWVPVINLRENSSVQEEQLLEQLFRLLGSSERPDQSVTLSARGGGLRAVVPEASPQQVERWRAKAERMPGLQIVDDPDFCILTLSPKNSFESGPADGPSVEG